MPSWSGLKSNFTILDSDDQLRLLKQLVQAANIDDKRWPARMLASIIGNWKNRALTPDKVPAADAGAYNNKGVELYYQYQTRLRELNAVDFDDLLLHMVTIFQTHPDDVGAISTLVPLHPCGRVSGYQRRPIPLAASAGRRAQEHLLRR